MYAVLKGSQLSFYKDQKHKDDNVLYHGEEPMQLEGCSVTIASDYSKKKNVLSLRLPVGAEYLLQAATEVGFFFIPLRASIALKTTLKFQLFQFHFSIYKFFSICNFRMTWIDGSKGYNLLLVSLRKR